MQCRTVKLPGGVAILCGRFPRRRPCSVCKVHVADKLCDGRVGTVGVSYSGGRATKAKTCDAPLCACCAATRPNPKKASDTLDYCPRCAPKASPEQLTMRNP
jgi:hypothetical protein